MENATLPLILIATHGNLGNELIKSAEIIIGHQENVKAIALMPGMDLEEFARLHRTALENADARTIVLCDLFGGTPSNVAASMGLDRAAVALSGVNLSMLIEACMMRAEIPASELSAALLQAGREGCKDLKVEMERLSE